MMTGPTGPLAAVTQPNWTISGFVTCGMLMVAKCGLAPREVCPAAIQPHSDTSSAACVPSLQSAQHFLSSSTLLWLLRTIAHAASSALATIGTQTHFVPSPASHASSHVRHHSRMSTTSWEGPASAWPFAYMRPNCTSRVSERIHHAITGTFGTTLPIASKGARIGAASCTTSCAVYCAAAAAAPLPQAGASSFASHAALAAASWGRAAARPQTCLSYTSFDADYQDE